MSSFQHFSPFTPRGQHTNLPPLPPSTGGATPPVTQLGTPSSPENGWDERYKTWNASTGQSCISSRAPGYGPSRRALGEIATNLATPSLGLASPFVPSDPNGVWGPPMPRTSVTKELDLSEQLALAEQRIRELKMENAQLKENAWVTHKYTRSPRVYGSPLISSRSSTFFDAVSQGGYSGMTALGVNFEDDDNFTPARRSSIADEGSDNSSGYVPPPQLINSILLGHFDYSQMHPEYIKAIVWTVAHRQPRNNTESSGLKAAVNALATRLNNLPRETESTNILVDAIVEWAKDLCYTSCGNYLCQQLIERGDVDDRMRFIEEIRDNLVAIASDKFGTHVLCKAIAVKELESTIAEALLKYGIFDSLKTGARRLWREYLERCRQSRDLGIFNQINEDMEGKWADLACYNEHGSIAVQQVFEVFGSQELMDPAFKEILNEVSRVANNQFGHFVVTKLLGNPSMFRLTCDGILVAHPPVATSHHGVNFAKTALADGGRTAFAKYVDAICSQEDGRTPGIVAIATSSIGKAHLTLVLSCLSPNESVRVRQVCRSFSTTLRNSQSGNDLLRYLGIIHAVGARHRTGLP